MDIIWQERAVAFACYDKIASSLTQSAHHRTTIALMLFFLNEARLRLRDFSFRIPERVVINHDDFVNDASVKKTVDDGADAPFFVVGRYNYADCLAFVHGYKITRDIMFLYDARISMTRIKEFLRQYRPGGVLM